MHSASVRPIPAHERRLPWLDKLWPSERILLGFFVYLVILSAVKPVSPVQRSFILAVPVAGTIFLTVSQTARNGSRAARQFASLLMILVAYWLVGCFSTTPVERWQSAWIHLDRVLLDTDGLRHWIEYGGPVFPWVLESLYLMLYAIPPLFLAVIYLCGAGDRGQVFLATLFTGTLTAYALLPLLPIQSPRLVFPGADLPAFHTSVRALNGWILSHLDITTSVFPSGHVAVAFSSAFGLLNAMPERRALWAGGFAIAALVYVATIYGRYHYTMDGAASIVISCAACRVARWWVPDAL